MISRDDADRALETLGEKFKIEHLKLDETSTALVQFADEHELIFEYLEVEKRFNFWTPIDSYNSVEDFTRSAPYTRHLLERNFPSRFLSGSYFALDSEIGVILLARTVHVNMNAIDRFIQEAETFAVQALDLSKTLRSDFEKLAPSEDSMPLSDGSDTTVIKV